LKAPPRVTIAYIVSLVVLGGLLGLTIIHPVSKSMQYSVIQNESLANTGNGWTLQFTLTNPFPQDTAFEIKVQLDAGQPYTQDVTVPAGHSYGFMMPISADDVKSGSKLHLNVFAGQASAPFEQETFDLNNG
jgi:hypothetical protein